MNELNQATSSPSFNNNFELNDKASDELQSTESESKPDINLSFLSTPPDSIENSEKLNSIEINPDSIQIETDTLAELPDSLKPDPRTLDSTARIELFKHKPTDVPYLNFHSRKQSKLLLQPSPNLKKRIIQIDSTGEFVEIKELIGDQKVRLLLKLPISEYLELKMKSREQSAWEELAYKYELKDSKKELSQFIKDITDFEIPLPSVGILSIFGAPKINLKIAGAVDIHGAWR
ncbi:MAG: hypothetical protein KF721_14135, partial [Ignavibacteriaceae bacterium]|nr:hypothetical protein [Ignavibacteriaceae bacterium]